MGAKQSLKDRQPPDAALTPEEILQGKVKKKERLGQWLATAICGNDITSSCLYVSGIVIVYARALAPLALLLAAGVLYLYRKIYTEVVEALPLDGGGFDVGGVRLRVGKLGVAGHRPQGEPGQQQPDHHRQLPGVEDDVGLGQVPGFASLAVLVA